MRWIVLLLVILGMVFFFNKAEQEQKITPVDNGEEPKPLVETFLDAINKEIDTQTTASAGALEIEVNETIDTLMENNLTMTFHLKNAPKEFLLMWFLDDGKIFATGEPTLTHSFALGEHPIRIRIYDELGETLLRERNITVRAWQYEKLEGYFYDRDSEAYALYDTKYYNHLHQLVLEYSDYFRKSYTYNEWGKLEEERYESTDNPESSYTQTYTYEDGKLRTQERVNDEGEVLESHLYDEEGKEIILKEHEEENQEQVERPKAKKFYNKDGNLTRIETLGGLYITNYRYKDGRMVYQEKIYPKGKIITQKSYSDNGLILNYDSKSLDSQGEQRTRYWYQYRYDEKGNKRRRELKNYVKEQLVTHVIEQWHYNKEGKVVLREEEALVGYCPCTADIVKSKTTYEYDSNGTEIAQKYAYQRENEMELHDSKPYKEVRSYTNVLE